MFFDAVKLKDVEFHMNKKFWSSRKQHANLIKSFNTKNFSIDVNGSEIFHYNLAECVKKWLQIE